MNDSHEHAVIQGFNALHRYVLLAGVVYVLALLAAGGWGIVVVGELFGIGVDTSGDGSGSVSWFGWTVITEVTFVMAFKSCNMEQASSAFFKMQRDKDLHMVFLREGAIGADYGPEGYDYITQQTFTLRAFVLGVIMVFLMLCVGHFSQHWGGWIDLIVSWVMLFIALMVFTKKPNDVAEKAIEMHEAVVARMREVNAENRVIRETKDAEKQTKKAAKKQRKHLRRLGVA